ncbi:MAG TPA: hypothetical protein VHZ01_09195 [Casimicrobiaceae bacterium]|nr:hypothetical protein [Casimicrobiaceae bacterium]
MPERQAELLEIGIRQVGKDVEINVVIGKDRAILPQTKVLEPIFDIGHGD